MSSPQVHPAVLCVLDGWGCAPASPGNAISLARTPEVDRMWGSWPHTTLAASGRAVGLPDGQQGNSEVGHLTIGAGRVLEQDLTRIDDAIADGSFFSNEVLLAAAALARRRRSRLHLLGLVSEGGVHSHLRHLLALLELGQRLGVEGVVVHAFMDGRDTPPTSGRECLAGLLRRLPDLGGAVLGSLGGRYFAMDRDQRWDRTRRALEAIRGELGAAIRDPLAYLAEQYAKGVGDEFVPPVAVADHQGRRVGLAAGDVVVHFNFRPDRARQLCHALVDREFRGFDRGPSLDLAQLVTLTAVDDPLEAEVAFPKPVVSNTLTEVIASAGIPQLHLAETEKYAHVTYFLNGGREEPFPQEDRTLVPSPRVATYDLVPEMSAATITDAAVEALSGGSFPFVVLNYANADMVGHSGNLQATVRAVEFLDGCLGRLARTSDSTGHLLLITADHGNAELTRDPVDGSPLTAHTTSRVPLLLGNLGKVAELRDGGGLRDVAPTLLEAMGLLVPEEMTGSDLLAGPVA